MNFGSMLGPFWDRFQNISCLQNAHRACTRAQVSRAEGLKIHRFVYMIFGIALSSFPNATFEALGLALVPKSARIESSGGHFGTQGADFEKKGSHNGPHFGPKLSKIISRVLHFRGHGAAWRP